MIVDGKGTPVAVYRSTQVDISRFGDVDEVGDAHSNKTLATE